MYVKLTEMIEEERQRAEQQLLTNIPTLMPSITSLTSTITSMTGKLIWII